ncbi:MAG: hypothetical protein LBP22_03490 [Deltaproteobacteria bacterium]|nr:hypothetical protein [Deltaproteobacteria bacterium]
MSEKLRAELKRLKGGCKNNADPAGALNILAAGQTVAAGCGDSDFSQPVKQEPGQ